MTEMKNEDFAAKVEATEREDMRNAALSSSTPDTEGVSHPEAAFAEEGEIREDGTEVEAATSKEEDEIMKIIQQDFSGEADAHEEAKGTIENPQTPSGSDKKNKPKTVVQSHNKINRQPLSAYTLFFKLWRSRLTREPTAGQQLDSEELEQEIEQKWKALDPKERERYIEMAKDDIKVYKGERNEATKPRSTDKETGNAMKGSCAPPKSQNFPATVAPTVGLVSLTKANHAGAAPTVTWAPNLVHSQSEPTDSLFSEEYWTNPALPTYSCETASAPSALAATLPLPFIKHGFGAMEQAVVPPGTIIVLFDNYGQPRHYRVDYHAYSMPFSKAVAYVEMWKQKAIAPTTQVMAAFIEPEHDLYHGRAYKPYQRGHWY